MNDYLLQAQMGWGCPGTGYGMMGGGYWGFFGWLFMVLFWAAVILVIVYLFRQIRGPAVPAAGETALDVLKRRYASGEITKEQFDEMKKEIE